MLRGGLSAAFGVLLALPVTAMADIAALRPADRDLLAAYARDTWRSLDTLSDTGALPSDHMVRSSGGWKAAAYTSPTDVAAYLWSTLAAEDLKLIDGPESGRRITRTLASLARVERSNGFFYNWYDPKTGDRLRIWPGGGAIRPFLSSVDNGWLAAALMMVANAHPDLRSQAEALLAPMNFGFFYDPYDAADPVTHPGLLRGGYFPEENAFSNFHYGMLNTEPRIASYVGIARGQIPPDHYFRMTRGRVDTKDAKASYMGISVAEATQIYRGLRFVPTWDGTMFEALMVPLFVPEADWAAESWGRNHSIYVKAQIAYGLEDSRIGFWGISASSDAEGGYHAFGVSALGSSGATRRRGGVVTPHASFLALPFAPREAMDNLHAMAVAFPALYGPNGFADAVDVTTGKVSDHVLTLDQGMILAAIANVLMDNTLQKKFSDAKVESAIRPVMHLERFACETGAAQIADLATPSLALPGRVPLPSDDDIARASNINPARLSSSSSTRRPRRAR